MSELSELYLQKKKSVNEIAAQYSCSEHKINYWLLRYKIQKRSISEAVYLKRNPGGDPFFFKEPSTHKDLFLFGLGLGLYWGEGNKKNTNTVRLGNTDPMLVKKFIEFLERIYSVPRNKFRFGLQIFSDTSPVQGLCFWKGVLWVSEKQFFKVIVTPARSLGTYREKTRHGVLTVYVSNKKLRNLLCAEIEKLQKIGYAPSVLP